MNRSGEVVANDFPEFFEALWGYEPFPWQVRLAQRVCAGEWPTCIALPTAAGKTACIDIAVFALACQADRTAAERTAARRVFFVVDRRVVVDQAYERAKKLSVLLADPTSESIRRVADALRSLAGDERPLDCYALRGGMYRETAWVRSPLQPTVITTTVDQVGSRLLFRGYGVSDSLKPIHAGLIGNDSLILLDEAHCSRPFAQTTTAIAKYRQWSDEPLLPFQFVSMTATPSEDVPDERIERDRDDDRAHPVLGRRIRASKPTKLVVADKARGKNWRSGLVKKLVEHVLEFAKDNGVAIGVIVNRVATARETDRVLRKTDDMDVTLLTGRMRPVDRVACVHELKQKLSGNSGPNAKPLVVVATQCLEVGADLDFHALVTECASLDALRQRFGRLNRRADRTKAEAVIVIRQDQREPAKTDADSDPVYGNSLANTWKWLKSNAEDEVFDFGTAAVNAKTSGFNADQLSSLNAPTVDAAVLLPAHLDCWVQTNPIPAPDPDPAVFLHGPERGIPNVQIVLRADLGEGGQEEWREIVSLCPPSSSEALPVRINAFRRWLNGIDVQDETSDVEGERVGDDRQPKRGAADANRRALRWRGPESERTEMIREPTQVHPGDTYVLSTSADQLHELGDFPPDEKKTDKRKPPADCGDEAFQRSRDRAILRLTPSIREAPALAGIETDDDAFDDILSDAIRSMEAAGMPEWLRGAVAELSKPKKRTVKPHPSGGFVVVGKNRLRRFDPTFIEADELPESSRALPVTLTAHCDEVAECARWFAEEYGLPSGIRDAFGLAGGVHDLGKADPRFQAWLHGGNRRKADTWTEPLAKSINPPRSRAELRRFRELACYPRGGRHELLSVRFAENDGVLPDDPCARDLILHLIATHHGYCRPFAPVVQDANPENVTVDHEGKALDAPSDTGLERLDSGVAERFWKLARRYGWWGLAHLEATFRLADWHASEAESNRKDKR